MEFCPFSSDLFAKSSNNDHGQQRQTPEAKAQHSAGKMMKPQIGP
jgi:hypothetical protein